MLGKAIDIFCRKKGIENYSIQFETLTYQELAANLVLDGNGNGLFSRKIGSAYAFVYDFLMAGTVNLPSDLKKELVRVESDLEKGINYKEACRISEVSGLVVMQSDMISIHTNRLEVYKHSDIVFQSIAYGYINYVILTPR